MKGLVLMGCLVLSAASCVTSSWIDQVAEEDRAAWTEAHPGEEMTEEIAMKLHVAAKLKVEAEAAKAQAELAKKGVEAAGHFSTGNYVAGVLVLIGLGGIGYGAIRKMKGQA